MSRENFKVTAKENNKEYWISRAVAVVGCIFTESKDGEIKFLLERRGEGCPDNVGKLAFPCGYLNWDESLEEAVRREVYEELGIDLKNVELLEWKIVSDPKSDARQNVVVRYVIYLKGLENTYKNLSELFKDSDTRGGEKDEVSEVLLLGQEDILNLPDEEFAFNHKKVILELLEEMNNLNKTESCRISYMD